MSALLRRQRERFYLRHPAQTLLMVISVSLAVALVVAIELVNHSALEAMRYARDQTLGTASHRVEARQGRLDQAIYRQLVRAHGLTAAPVINGSLRDDTGQRFNLVGRDPIAENSLQSRYQADAVDGDLLADMLLGEALLLASPETAARLNGHLRLADTSLRLADSTALAGQATTLVGDIGLVQRLLGWPGQLSAIELRLGAEQAQRLATSLPDTLTLRATQASDPGAQGMVEAFQLNLRALALLSLLVAALLVGNSLRFLVLQRSRQLATLQAIGQRPASQWRGLLLEAATLGTLAGLLGLLLGYVLASQMLGLVVRTLSDVYLQTLSESLRPTPVIAAIALALAIASSLAGIALPLFEHRRIPLAQALTGLAGERQSQHRLPALATIGLASAALGLALLFVTEHLPSLFFALFLIATGGSLVQLGLVSGASRWLARHGPVRLRLSARLLHGATPRLASGVIGLSLAVATVVGIATMISSFRSSTENWLGQTLYAPHYLSHSQGFDQTTLAALEQWPEVGAVFRAGESSVMLASGTRLPLSVVEADRRRLQGFQLAAEPTKTVDVTAFSVLGSLLLSESLGRRLELPAGATITTAQDQTLTVQAWVRDYRSPLGRGFIHWQTAEQLGLQPAVTSLGIEPAPGKAEALANRLREWSASESDVEWFSRRQIQRQSMQVFNQTFRITHVLHSLAAVVAGLSLFGALLNWQLSRRHDLALLRALGLSPRGLATQLTLQSLWLGTLTAALALPLGIGLAAALIEVVNVQSFGWSMQLTIAGSDLAYGAGIALFSAVAAGLAAVGQALRPDPASVLGGQQ